MTDARHPFTVFLDRDGVFDVHKPRGVVHWSRFEWLPGVQDAFARLDRPDIQTCLCTNQPWVGLGLATKGMVRRVNDRMQAGLAEAGGRLDRMEAAFAPPYLPHRRRKPRPGMLEDGATWFAQNMQPVDRRRAVMVGDKVKDAIAGNRFGIPGILLATTQDRPTLQAKVEEQGIDAIIVSGLPEAVDEILRRADA